MKWKIAKAMALVMALICLLCFPVPVSAISQGTDGTELEVLQPQNLEIQLGQEWAGVEFTLKTDFGMYPGVIPVGADGILRLEIGGSENYILSCLNSSADIPGPSETQPTADETSPLPDVEITDETLSTEESTPNDTSDEKSFAGIPVAHIIQFGGGMMIAVGTLAGLHFRQKRSEKHAVGSYDENDEI